MTMQDLLYSKHIDEAIRLTIKDYDDPKLAFKAFKIWIQELKGLTPSRETENDICIPIQYADDLNDEITVTWHADIFHKAEIDEYIPDNELASLDITFLTDKEVEDMLEKYKREDPISSYAYEFNPWEEWLRIEVFHSALTEENTATVLSMILHEMSFNGLTRESQEERRAEMQASIEEVEQINRLPKEEQDKYYTSWEEFRAELEKELGIVDTRTEEDEEQEHLRLMRTILWDMIAKEKAILEYKRSLC